MTNLYSRAEKSIELIRNPLAIKVLLELYPSNKYNYEQIAKLLDIDVSDARIVFDELDKMGMIRDNPASGMKVLTDEAKLWLEQIATVFPDLKTFLNKKTAF